MMMMKCVCERVSVDSESDLITTKRIEEIMNSTLLYFTYGTLRHFY